jgi:competence protein ComEA
VNINTAEAQELMTLKRIGPRLAERIIEYRRQFGPFTSPQSLMAVKGIGPKTLEANVGRIVVR